MFRRSNLRRIRPEGAAPGHRGSARRLVIEPLEDRRLLAGGGVAAANLNAPWCNPLLPLDVNHDGFVQPPDAAIAINRLITTGIGPLRPPDPAHPPQFYYDTNGDNMFSPADALRIINRLFSPPEVTLSTLLPFTIDLTPEVTVKAAGAAVSDGAQVLLDVDADGDGRFASDELGRTTWSLYRGAATFDIAPGLAPDDPQVGPYHVSLRARVVDSDGVEGTSAVQQLEVDTRMSNQLQNYVDTLDPAYQYSLARTITGTGYTSYVIDMKSQQWRSAADVDKPIWQHWLQIIVPSGAIGTSALMYIHGGSTNPNPPTSVDSTLVAYALATRTVIVDLPDVPNEPLTFTGDPGNPRSEDEIIAYSYDQYMRHIGEPGNETWPVLQAMVKSAVRAMDTVQSFVPTVVAGGRVDDFVITGYSKRGWTTWLTAAVDDRIRAIIPGVFDMLNQGPELVHHYGAYGFFSDQIQDYTNLQIFERITTPEGRLLGQIVDPYRYLSNGRYEIPKLILVSSGDQFFVSDSAQYYFHDLPGEDNYLRYIPNTGHGLDGRAPQSTLSFYSALLNGWTLPKLSWTIDPDQTIRVRTDTTPTQVLLWQATNTTERDFRQFYPGVPASWTSSVLTDQGGNTYLGNTPIPAAGATAYFIELTFPSPIAGNPYVFTTEIRVNTNLPLYPWPFPVDGGVEPLAAAGPPDLNATAAALSSLAAAPGPPPGGAEPPAVPQATEADLNAVETGIVEMDSRGDPRPEPIDGEPADLVLAGSLDELLG